MNKLLFVALCISSLSACCFGPQYRPQKIPKPALVTAAVVVPVKKAFVVETLPNSAHGKIATSSIEETPFNGAAVRIDMPTIVNRGQNIFIGVYPPTEAKVTDIVAVIGIANYLNLNKQPDTSFTGYFRVPELFDPGQYTMSFFIRTKDNKRRVVQRLLTVQQ